jgi:type VI secretion system protein ImpC
MPETTYANRTSTPLHTLSPTDIVEQMVGVARTQTDGQRQRFRQQLQALFTAIRRRASGEAPMLAAAFQSKDPETILNALITHCDEQLSARVNAILHHQAFQRLEGSWRGLRYLVDKGKTGPLLQLYVRDMTKDECRKDLEKAGGKLERSTLYQEVMTERFATPGGKPFTLLLADYEVNHQPQDLSLLEKIAQIAALGHVPCITGAHPSLLGLEKWTELYPPFDIAMRFEAKEYIPWKSFRTSENSRYMVLVLARMLGRLPYGPDTRPAEGFCFKEDVDGKDHAKYLWVNGVYGLGLLIMEALRKHGWAFAIRGEESGGKLEDLPLHLILGDGGAQDVKCPTEVYIDDELHTKLTRQGLTVLSSFKDTNFAVIFNTPSVQQPREFDTPQATASAFLTAQLQYIMAVSRIAHGLNVLLRRYIGMSIEQEEIERRLNRWLDQYENDAPDASQEMRSHYPFREARAFVTKMPRRPGFYQTTIFLRPHIQYEGMMVTMHLVTEIPQIKQNA